jgi:hypothetical protein
MNSGGLSMGEEEDAGGQSGRARGGADLDIGGALGGTSETASAPIKGLPRTDFVLEFAWKPQDDPKKRKAASDWMADIKKYGPRLGTPPAHLLEDKPAAPPTQQPAPGTLGQPVVPATPQGAPAGAQPATPPQGAPANGAQAPNAPPTSGN